MDIEDDYTTGQVDNGISVPAYEDDYTTGQWPTLVENRAPSGNANSPSNYFNDFWTQVAGGVSRSIPSVVSGLGNNLASQLSKPQSSAGNQKNTAQPKGKASTIPWMWIGIGGGVLVALYFFTRK